MLLGLLFGLYPMWADALEPDTSPESEQCLASVFAAGSLGWKAYRADRDDYEIGSHVNPPLSTPESDLVGETLDSP